MRSLLLAAALFGLTACSDPFADAQALDTVEAYEAFLAANASSPYRTQAEIRLEELYLEQARASKTLEAYDTYLEKFPTGHHAAVAKEERRDSLFAWADEQDTPEAWQKFIDEYPTGNKKLRQKARKRMRMAQHRSEIALGPVEMEQINLAEDPDGPLNGYGFFVEVTTNTKEPVSHLMLKISYLDEQGKVLDEDEWPAVAPALPGNLPVVEAFKVPMKPGETRTWEWATGDMPVGWAKKSRIKAVDIRFASEAEE